MKTKVVSFEVAKRLVETGFIGKSYLRWEISSTGEAKLEKTISNDKAQLVSMNELKDKHNYPAYSIEELLYEIYSLMKSNRIAGNSIPILLLNVSAKLEDKHSLKKLIKNPADFIAIQFIKASEKEYMLEKPKDRSFSFSD